jgi:predicted CoA-binding protein
MLTNYANDDAWLKRLFLEVRTIAVVGLSHDETKPSFEVAAYLQKAGYRIIPVNPQPGVILGEAVYADLAAIPVPVDLVDVFRRAEACAEIARQASALRPRAIWLQLGISSEEAARVAEAAKIPIVMNRCAKLEHRRLLEMKLLDPDATV